MNIDWNKVEEGYSLMQTIEKENKKLKQEIERLNKCYCERTDCSGRIKNSKKYESVQEENERLHFIIKEVREYIENHSITNMGWWITGQQKVECKFMEDANPQELLELLDKGSDKE